MSALPICKTVTVGAGPVSWGKTRALCNTAQPSTAKTPAAITKPTGQFLL